MAIKDCVRRLALPPSYTCLYIWSDYGPHFHAYAFLATAVDFLQTSPHLTTVYFNFFGEHHGKGRNDGQFGLQRRWLDSFTQRHVIASAENLLRALKEGASQSMTCDPPPKGPCYQIMHFHPKKPLTFLYLDNTATDLKVEYTYCLGFFKTKSTKNPARIVNFIYSDRVSLPDVGRNLGVASVVDRVCADSNWRVL